MDKNKQKFLTVTREKSVIATRENSYKNTQRSR